MGVATEKEGQPRESSGESVALLRLLCSTDCRSPLHQHLERGYQGAEKMPKSYATGSSYSYRHIAPHLAPSLRINDSKGQDDLLLQLPTRWLAQAGLQLLLLRTVESVPHTLTWSLHDVRATGQLVLTRAPQSQNVPFSHFLSPQLCQRSPPARLFAC
jgi:hypothetical protein